MTDQEAEQRVLDMSRKLLANDLSKPHKWLKTKQGQLWLLAGSHCTAYLNSDSCEPMSSMDTAELISDSHALDLLRLNNF